MRSYFCDDSTLASLFLLCALVLLTFPGCDSALQSDERFAATPEGTAEVAIAQTQELRSAYDTTQLNSLRNAVLCKCIYDQLEPNCADVAQDGSLGGFIEMGNFSLDDFEAKNEEVAKRIEQTAFESKHGNQLGIAKCLEATAFVFGRGGK